MRRIHARTGLALTLIGGAALFLSSPGAADKVVSRKRLVPTGALPPKARSSLSKAMASHAGDMTALQMAIVLLDFSAIEQTARRLDRGMFARPATPQHRAASEIPDQFFQLQDQFAESVERLRATAQVSSVAGVTEAYANIVRSCVGCHAAYLYQDGGERPAR